MFVHDSARRFLRYWTGFWSFAPAYLEREPFDLPNVPFCTTLSLFLICGLVSWGRSRGDTLLPFALLVAVFPIPYYLTHASMDYRQPVEPELVMLITAGMLAVRDRVTAQAEAGIEIAPPDLDLVPS